MPPIAIGANAIDFNLPGVDGKSHSLASLSDAKVLAIFWSCNHCPYVQAYERRLMELQKEFGDKGVQFVAINSNTVITHPADSFDKMVERASEIGFNFLYLHDESQETAKAFSAQRTPELFVFDDSRTLRYQGGIDDSWDNASAVTKRPLRAAIEALLRGQSPNPEQTPPVGCTIKWSPA